MPVKGLQPYCSSAVCRAKFVKWLMLDLRETVCMRGEGDDTNLFSFEVKMKPKLQFLLAEEL